MGAPTITEFVDQPKHSIPAEDREYSRSTWSRPRYTTYQNTYPSQMGDCSDLDIGGIWDKVRKTIEEKVVDPQVDAFKKTKKKVQEFISGREEEEKKKEQKPKVEKKEPEKVPEPPKLTEEQKKKEKEQLIKSYQSYLSSPHAIIGAPYSGPTDGKINAQLVAAAKRVESSIASTLKSLGDPNSGRRVYGQLYNPVAKTFNTSIADLDAAIALMVKYQDIQNKNKV
jgi:hypothetical protein